MANSPQHPEKNAASTASIVLSFASVRGQRAAVGLLEFADAARDGAGEGALLVAEQFGFQQVLRDRRAIDRDERLLGAAASGACT